MSWLLVPCWCSEHTKAVEGLRVTATAVVAYRGAEGSEVPVVRMLAAATARGDPNEKHA